MSEAAVRNWLRARAVNLSRATKGLFMQNGALSRDGEVVLADLREYCFAQKSTFDPDARVQARREGRREVWLRLTKSLNLDESEVQKLMEVDDGL